MTDGVRLVESVFLPPGRLLRVIAAFLVAVRRFRVVAALRAATRRFRVTAAFRAAEVTIRQLLRRMTRGVWLTHCRSGASGAHHQHHVNHRDRVTPLVGCSGMLAGLIEQKCSRDPLDRSADSRWANRTLPKHSQPDLAVHPSLGSTQVRIDSTRQLPSRYVPGTSRRACARCQPNEPIRRSTSFAHYSRVRLDASIRSQAPIHLAPQPSLDRA